MLKNIILFFTNYAKDVPISKMVSHAIILLVVTSWLGFITLFVLNFKTISGMYIDYKENQKSHIVDALTITSKVNNLITDQRIRMGVDRLYVSKFHDGTRDLQKVHFYYFSRISESTGGGVSTEMTQTQDLPLSIFPGMVKSLSAGKCYHVNLKNTTVENSSYFTFLGVSATTICPIYNKEESLIGIVGAEDVINPTIQNNPKKVDNMLNTLSIVLGDLLTSG